MLTIIGKPEKVPWLGVCRLFPVQATVPDTHQLRSPTEPISLTENHAIRVYDISFKDNKPNKVFFRDLLAKRLVSDRPDGLIPTIVVDEGNQALGTRSLW